MITNLKTTLAKDIVAQFLDNMQRLGIQEEDVISLISEYIEGDKHDTVRM